MKIDIPESSVWREMAAEAETSIEMMIISTHIARALDATTQNEIIKITHGILQLLINIF